MNDLENKLSQEIKPECTVVACRFPFPNWKEIATIGEGVDSVWVYKPGQRIPEAVSYTHLTLPTILLV